MADLDTFKDLVAHEENSGVFGTWKNSSSVYGGTGYSATNPKFGSDLDNWYKFSRAVLAGQSPAIPTMLTEHGKALIDSAVMALPETEPTPPVQPPPPMPRPKPTGKHFGISTGAGPDTITDTSVDRNRYLDLVKSLGSLGIRLDAASTSDSNLDDIVAKAIVRGLDYLPVVRPVGMASLSPSALASLALSIAKKYVPQFPGQAIELGNEPNLANFYGGTPSPDGWRQRHNAAFQAIKSWDSSVTVISAGLAPVGKLGDSDSNRMNPLTFLMQALLAGPLEMDVFGWHGYDYWNNFTASQMFGRGTSDQYSSRYQLYLAPTNALGILRQAGHTPLVEMTEVGVPTGGPVPHGTTEDAQAQYIPLLLAWWLQQPFARNLWWYSLKDRPRNTGDEKYFGLVHGDFSPKPGLAAFERAVALAA